MVCSNSRVIVFQLLVLFVTGFMVSRTLTKIPFEIEYVREEGHIQYTTIDSFDCRCFSHLRHSPSLGDYLLYFQTCFLLFRVQNYRCRSSALSKLCYYRKRFCDACFDKKPSTKPMMFTTYKATENKDDGRATES